MANSKALANNRIVNQIELKNRKFRKNRFEILVNFDCKFGSGPYNKFTSYSAALSRSLIPSSAQNKRFANGQ